MPAKQPMIDMMQNGTSDIIYTPKKAVRPLLELILPYCYAGDMTIWECADPGESKITEAFKEEGFNVISTDIVTGYDFLEYEPEEEYNMIVTNPPYSIKDAFINRCFKLKKPFALLLPLTALEGVRRGKMWSSYGVSLLVLDRRLDFTGKKANWFNTSWFIGNFFVDNRLFFASIEKG
jgi:hypothetical protein